MGIHEDLIECGAVWCGGDVATIALQLEAMGYKKVVMCKDCADGKQVDRCSSVFLCGRHGFEKRGNWYCEDGKPRPATSTKKRKPQKGAQGQIKVSYLGERKGTTE